MNTMFPNGKANKQLATSIEALSSLLRLVCSLGTLSGDARHTQRKRKYAVLGKHVNPVWQSLSPLTLQANPFPVLTAFTSLCPLRLNFLFVYLGDGASRSFDIRPYQCHLPMVLRKAVRRVSVDDMRYAEAHRTTMHSLPNNNYPSVDQ